MGAHRRRRETEEDAAVVRRGLAHVWQIESLRRIYCALPVPRAGAHRLRVARLVPLPATLRPRRRRPAAACSAVAEPVAAHRPHHRRPGRHEAASPRTRSSSSGCCRKAVVRRRRRGARVRLRAGRVASRSWPTMVIAACLAFVVPGRLRRALARHPAARRSIGFSMARCSCCPGVVIAPVVVDHRRPLGIRWGLAAHGAGVPRRRPRHRARAGDVISRDIKQVWTAAAARCEVLYERRQGRVKLLLVRGLDVSYGDVQVLFDVDFESRRGRDRRPARHERRREVDAAQGDLRRSSRPNKGAVIFDGRDITHAPPHEIAPRGIVLGARRPGVFPSLTVAENLRVAGWIDRRDKQHRRERAERGARDLPGAARAARTSRPRTCRAASSRCSRLGMAFLSRPAAADDRRALARPRAR